MVRCMSVYGYEKRIDIPKLSREVREIAEFY